MVRDVKKEVLLKKRRYITEKEFLDRWRRNPRNKMKKDDLYKARKNPKQRKLNKRYWYGKKG